MNDEEKFRQAEATTAADLRNRITEVEGVLSRLRAQLDIIEKKQKLEDIVPVSDRLKDIKPIDAFRMYLRDKGVFVDEYTMLADLIRAGCSSDKESGAAGNLRRSVSRFLKRGKQATDPPVLIRKGEMIGLAEWENR